MRKCILFLLLFAAVSVSARNANQIQLDSLLSANAGAKEDTNKVKLLRAISMAYGDGDPRNERLYGEAVIALSQKLGWSKGISLGLTAVAFSYQAQADFPKALDFLFKALAIDEKEGDGKMIAGNLDNIGTIYSICGDFPKALCYYTQSLQKNEQLHNRRGVATTLGNMAGVYGDQHDYLKALDYYTRSADICEAEGMREGVLRAHVNIAAIYQEQGNFVQSLNINFEGLREAQGQGDKVIMCAIYGNIGSCYLSIAKDSVHRSLQNESIPSRRAAVGLATKYLMQSVELCSEIQNLDVLEESYHQLSEVQELDGKSRAALQSFKNYIAIKDSIHSDDNKVKLANLATQREEGLKVKQIEINRLSKKNEVEERIFYCTGIFLLLAIIAFIFRNYSAQRRLNILLSQEKEKSDGLARSQEELLLQQDGLMLQLNNSAQMKSKFLANISHELRTPVTLLTGMLELMKDKKGAIADAERSKMNIAYNNSRKLQNMVEEILDLSKLEISEAKLQKEPMEIAPLVRRMVYAFESFIEKEHLRFEYEDQRAAGYFCLIDEIRFEKIINNIVYNALKFNKENGLIRTEVYPDENREHVIISISDSGHGIREQDLPHIFERFYQGDTVRVKAEGAGIGLSLVKEFTVQMGGTVSVVSKLGSGTTFTLVFPVGENELVAVPASEEAIEVTWERFPNRQNVLIVEDNKEMRYYIKEVLGDAVNIWEAVNGKDALEQMAKYSPDLIISDIMMPVMDGREFVQHVKKSDAYRKIPFITITALTDKENEITMLRSGVDDYVVKPFVGAELRTKAYNLLSNYAERLLSNSLPEESDDISPDSKHAEEFREKITEYVLARLKNSTISVFDLAYELALSERQLYRFAKNLTGCTPAQLIKEVRLMKAQELLVSGVINKIEDVSKRVGYENAGYFSRQFFERFGKRPTEYL